MKPIVKQNLAQLAFYLESYGGMNSTVTIYKPGECTTIEVDGIDEMRAKLIDAVLHGAEAVMTASEVWKGKAQETEGVLVTYEDAEGFEMYMAEIHRDGDHISLSEWKPIDKTNIPLGGIFEHVRSLLESN